MPEVIPMFRAALTAHLQSSEAIGDLVGGRMYYGTLPQDYDPTGDGPALTYLVTSWTTGHVLEGASRIEAATVQVASHAGRIRDADLVTEAVRDLLDGARGAWGDPAVEVLSCTQQGETDIIEEPSAGSARWTYQIASDYLIRHRVTMPTLE